MGSDLQIAGGAPRSRIVAVAPLRSHAGLHSNGSHHTRGRAPMDAARCAASAPLPRHGSFSPGVGRHGRSSSLRRRHRDAARGAIAEHVGMWRDDQQQVDRAPVWRGPPGADSAARVRHQDPEKQAVSPIAEHERHHPGASQDQNEDREDVGPDDGWRMSGWRRSWPRPRAGAGGGGPRHRSDPGLRGRAPPTGARPVRDARALDRGAALECEIHDGSGDPAAGAAFAASGSAGGSSPPMSRRNGG